MADSDVSFNWDVKCTKSTFDNKRDQSPHSQPCHNEGFITRTLKDASVDKYLDESICSNTKPESVTDLSHALNGSEILNIHEESEQDTLFKTTRDQDAVSSICSANFTKNSPSYLGEQSRYDYNRDEVERKPIYEEPAHILFNADKEPMFQVPTPPLSQPEQPDAAEKLQGCDYH